MLTGRAVVVEVIINKYDINIFQVLIMSHSCLTERWVHHSDSPPKQVGCSLDNQMVTPCSWLQHVPANYKVLGADRQNDRLTDKLNDRETYLQTDRQTD